MQIQIRFCVVFTSFFFFAPEGVLAGLPGLADVKNCKITALVLESLEAVN